LVIIGLDNIINEELVSRPEIEQRENLCYGLIFDEINAIFEVE